MAGAISIAGEKAFKRMLELDTVRGPHSTGVAAVNIKGEVTVAKQVGTPWDFYEYPSTASLFSKVNNVLLGHNRWATKGAINKRNAHPFEFDTLVGVHNGTLRSTYNLDDYKEFTVDSENLYHHMNNHGVYDTIPVLNGAFALAWYDKDLETINLIRNSERTLCYTFSEDKKTLFWASEPWIIQVAASSAGVKIEQVRDVTVGVLHSFKVPLGFPTKEFEATRIRKLNLYSPPKVVTSYTGPATKNVVPFSVGAKVKRPFSEYVKYCGKSCTFSVGKELISSSQQPFLECYAADNEDIVIRVFPDKGSDLWKEMLASTGYFNALVKSYNGLENGYLTIDIRTVVPVVSKSDDIPEDLVAGFGGELINEEEFDERSKKGCAWCASPVFFKDADEVQWFTKNDCLCPICADQPEVKQYLN
ncbi:Glutamine--fructose-6-phosphate aminotransferase [isomerizing] [compost metagenome]